MSLRIDLFVVDPQLDFCHPKGALFVPGADEDMKRLTTLVHRISPKLNDIHVTLDTHHNFDIAHPSFWVDAKGNPPHPFTTITYDDVKGGVWRPAIPAYYSRETFQKKGIDRDGVLEYTKSLANSGRYQLMVWPPHCLIGSWGFQVVPELWDTFHQWEKDNRASVDFIQKGSNPYTEHYSCVQADVPDPSDPTTSLNISFLETLQKSDVIIIAGEALSHCIANSVIDVANNFGEENIKKMVLLTDCTSNVTGCSALGDQFIKEMTARGMQLSTSDKILV